MLLRPFFFATVCLHGHLWRAAAEVTKDNDPMCVEVTLTGTGGGPVLYNGLAAHGTLVTYGPKSKKCRGVANLQFDMGRGTTLRLSEIGMQPTLPPMRTPENQLTKIFLTHIHLDHAEDLSTYLRAKWLFSPVAAPPLQAPIDIYCSESVTGQVNGLFLAPGQPPVPNRTNVTTSCEGLVASVSAEISGSGELAQRIAERPSRKLGGPVEMATVNTFEWQNEAARVVWIDSDNGVNVTAIGTNHIPGHISYRINTPVGSVVIGGSSSNDNADPRNRTTSASEQLRVLAEGADILVQAIAHPIMLSTGNTGQAYPRDFFNRQTEAKDLGTLAQEAGVGVIMTSHMIPSVDAPVWGAWTIPDLKDPTVAGTKGVTKDDYSKAVSDGFVQGSHKPEIIIGSDLTKWTIPPSSELGVYDTKDDAELTTSKTMPTNETAKSLAYVFGALFIVALLALAYVEYVYVPKLRKEIGKDDKNNYLTDNETGHGTQHGVSDDTAHGV